jgi:hypothetical protein
VSATEGAGGLGAPTVASASSAPFIRRARNPPAAAAMTATAPMTKTENLGVTTGN